MPDLTKHLARAKAAFDKGACDMALEILFECVDVDPTQVEIYKLLLPVAKRKAKEAGGKSSFFGLGGLKMPSFSNDPLKQFIAAIKHVGKTNDHKALASAVEAAARLSATMKAMTDVAIQLGEDHRATGMFSDRVMWILGNQYNERFNASGEKDTESLDRAIKTMAELERNMPTHSDAGRTLKNWMAKRSISSRAKGGKSGDYTGQVANLDVARRQEVMNRIIRTADDARDVQKYIEEDLKRNPADKHLWTKLGDTHRRVIEFLPKGDAVNRAKEVAASRAAYTKAQEIDPHDFMVTMKIGELRMAELRDLLSVLPPGSPEQTAARKELLEAEIAEFRARIERQPTDMNHRYNLGTRLMLAGDIDGAAAEFQRTVNDPKLRRGSHRYLGRCFKEKKLLDLAIQQYKLFLPLVEDELSEDAKDGRYQLAGLYEDRGMKAEAIAEFEKLIAIDLGFKDAAARLSKLRGP